MIVTDGVGVVLALRETKDLLLILQCTGQSPLPLQQRLFSPKYSIVPRLKNPELIHNLYPLFGVIGVICMLLKELGMVLYPIPARFWLRKINL